MFPWFAESPAFSFSFFLNLASIFCFVFWGIYFYQTLNNNRKGRVECFLRSQHENAF